MGGPPLLEGVQEEETIYMAPPQIMRGTRRATTPPVPFEKIFPVQKTGFQPLGGHSRQP